MSIWFKSYIIYGVKLTYKEFEELIGDKIWEDDSLRIENNEQGIGWDADGMNGEYALFGKIVHNGEDNGNDRPLGGNGGMQKIKMLTPREKKFVRGIIEQQLGKKYANSAAYYVVGDYS